MRSLARIRANDQTARLSSLSHEFRMHDGIVRPLIVRQLEALLGLGRRPDQLLAQGSIVVTRIHSVIARDPDSIIPKYLPNACFCDPGIETLEIAVRASPERSA